MRCEIRIEMKNELGNNHDCDEVNRCDSTQMMRMPMVVIYDGFSLGSRLLQELLWLPQVRVVVRYIPWGSHAYQNGMRACHSTSKIDPKWHNQCRKIWPLLAYGSVNLTPNWCKLDP